MKPEEIRSRIQQAAHAWMTGNAEAFAELFVPDGEFIVPGDRWIGRAAIRQAVVDFAAAHSHVQIEIQRILIDGDSAVVEWHWQEEIAGTHNSADDAIAIDFQNGLISRWREYIDTQSCMKSTS
ncbi:SgcJ/EcaC family oxidoreductase [Gloeocapsopsis sp. IPPAS B-1203]|uniref:nuclear transport factor 2 family protein n=1 Tax=Gloeocapsopsis sp. IPPAS B-1203 TaxID=2049454 RepID=UPI000C186FF5|nr:SgcJ/EcaC family oxidoreductase [Gloeocapsopsis sp. IPPAS B-1203]PIG93659.1 DUF4440 domain-containing protein [Gloeocapsopsis sp. IPPAS B-1203]